MKNKYVYTIYPYLSFKIYIPKDLSKTIWTQKKAIKIKNYHKIILGQWNAHTLLYKYVKQTPAKEQNTYMKYQKP